MEHGIDDFAESIALAKVWRDTEHGMRPDEPVYRVGARRWGRRRQLRRSTRKPLRLALSIEKRRRRTYGNAKFSLNILRRSEIRSSMGEISTEPRGSKTRAADGHARSDAHGTERVVARLDELTRRLPEKSPAVSQERPSRRDPWVRSLLAPA